jgi:predicted dehydrogenase
MDKIRVGIIGTGGIAQGHIQRISVLPGVEITALVDPSEEHIVRTRKRQPVTADAQAFDDYKGMLDSGITDAVIIASPHTCHTEQIMDSLEKGQHVLCEKPMVCTIDDAVKVVKKVRELGLTFQISYQRHFQGGFRYIRRVITSGALGEVEFVSAAQGQNWYRNVSGTWRQKMSLSGGGQLNDSGSHLVDIILWTSGLAIESVAAYTDNFDTEVDINSALSLKFTSGAQGNISIIGNCPGFWEDLTYVGTKGAIFSRQSKIRHVNAETGDVAEMVDFADAGDPDSNFIGAIRGKEEVQMPVECGLRVIELTEAAWQSGEKNGMPVTVPHTNL